jgi:hypothetical protein
LWKVEVTDEANDKRQKTFQEEKPDFAKLAYYLGAVADSNTTYTNQAARVCLSSARYQRLAEQI